MYHPSILISTLVYKKTSSIFNAFYKSKGPVSLRDTVHLNLFQGARPDGRGHEIFIDFFGRHEIVRGFLRGHEMILENFRGHEIYPTINF